MTTLSDLRARVLAGSGEDGELTDDLWRAFGYAALTSESLRRYGYIFTKGRDLLTDLNAVTALVEERLPGWAWSVGNLAGGGQAYLMRKGGGMVGGNAPSPARALLAALLTAEIEKMEMSDALRAE